MSIEQLTQILRPPEKPIEVPSKRDWAIIEMITGKLPKDYHSFLETYGTGCINEFIYIFNPASMDRHINLFNIMWVVLESKKEFRKKFPKEEPLPLFPEPCGLLPLGSTGNGDNIFWRMQGNPERWSWRVVVWECRSSEWQEFDTELTGFLLRVLLRQEVCKIFPNDFGTKNSFTPEHCC